MHAWRYAQLALHVLEGWVGAIIAFIRAHTQSPLEEVKTT